MSIRTFFNSLAPNRFYIPQYGPDDTLVVAGKKDRRTDLPRFGGDNLLSAYGGSLFEIESVARGYYTSNRSNAEFVHDNVSGEPHYELHALFDSEGFHDNFLDSDRSLSQDSRFFIAARLADSRFVKPIEATARRVA